MGWGGPVKGQDRSQDMDFFFFGVCPSMPAWPASMLFVAWLWLVMACHGCCCKALVLRLASTI